MKYICLFLFLFLLICRANSRNSPSFSIDSRIVGGERTTIEGHPYQVALKVSTENGKFLCGGSIISSWWILTAAHCFKNEPYKVLVRVGSKYKTRGEDIEVARYAIHPLYDPSNFDKDVAVLLLGRELLLNEWSIRPIRLAETEPLPKSLVTVSGWGRTNEKIKNSPAILKEVTIPVMSREDCARHYPDQFTSDMFCAGLKSGGKDSCQGDSGGPAVTEDGELAGVVSFGHGCARAGAPGVYASVATPAIGRWISSFTGV